MKEDSCLASSNKLHDNRDIVGIITPMSIQRGSQSQWQQFRCRSMSPGGVYVLDTISSK